MRAAKATTKPLINIPKKYAAKVRKIDPTIKELDIAFVGGLNAGNMIKYFQKEHFHGTMGGFNHKTKFYLEQCYEYLITSNLKGYKYTAMPFSANFNSIESKFCKDTIVNIDPVKNELETDKGEIYKYKALVLNTGLDQKGANWDVVKPYINDEFAKTRVFVQEPGNIFQIQRNTRLMIMHKDLDLLIYLPEGPSRREALDHWYLMLDTYLSRGLYSENRSRNMKIRIITPNNFLLKFPFANEVMLDQISQRSMIEVHYGMELTNIDIKETPIGLQRNAKFKDLKTGTEIEMPFGTLLTSVPHKKRAMYEKNDIADEDGLIKVNPYSLQHVKYPNIFGFGDGIDAPTTRNLYATLNQGSVVRNNLWDYVHGKEMKAVYEGYSSWHTLHALDKMYVFKHYYNYVPTAFNFYMPKFLGWPAYKIKSSLERTYLTKIYQAKVNFGYPYLSKNKYFRPLVENRFAAENKLSAKDIFPHEYVKPLMSYDIHGHDFGFLKEVKKVKEKKVKKGKKEKIVPAAEDAAVAQHH